MRAKIEDGCKSSHTCNWEDSKNCVRPVCKQKLKCDTHFQCTVTSSSKFHQNPWNVGDEIRSWTDLVSEMNVLFTLFARRIESGHISSILISICSGNIRTILNSFTQIFGETANIGNGDNCVTVSTL
jgi:hypothetical protein